MIPADRDYLDGERDLPPDDETGPGCLGFLAWLGVAIPLAWVVALLIEAAS